MSRLRVCIDGVPLLVRSAGVKTYVYYWSRALRKLAGRDRVHLFPFIGEPGPCEHESSVMPMPQTLQRLGLMHMANESKWPVLAPLGWYYDVFHASHQLLEPPKNTAVTATLYDMTCWTVPETHDPANVSMARRFADKVIRRAAGLIAISSYTRDDAVRVLNLSPDKIKVIYPGISERFFDAEPTRRAKPYALFVGTIEPRKNVARLVDAWTALPADVRDHYDLLIAGPPGWGDPQFAERLKAGIPGVTYLGYVPEADLPSLTAGASLFVYPSLYEGFGLPVAQAMAARVAVLTSNRSCLPEVAGAGGRLADPESLDELRAALLDLLTSPAARETLAAAGRRRAELYRWEIAARDSWEYFQQIAGRA